MFNQSRAESRSAPGTQCPAAELVRRTRIYLDDGGDELHQEAGEAQERWEEVVEEVHDQALDVRAIMVLVCHDHQVTIPQGLDRVIALRPQANASQSSVSTPWWYDWVIALLPEARQQSA